MFTGGASVFHGPAENCGILASVDNLKDSTETDLNVTGKREA